MEVFDQTGEIIAYLHRRIVVGKDFKTAGIILDSSLYNKKGMCCGNYFDNCFRNKDGFITGITKAQNIDSIRLENSEAIITGGWEIIEQIHRFEYLNVPSLKQWDQKHLLFYLLNE